MARCRFCVRSARSAARWRRRSRRACCKITGAARAFCWAAYRVCRLLRLLSSAPAWLGTCAAQMFLGMGAHVTVLDQEPGRACSASATASRSVVTMIVHQTQYRAGLLLMPMWLLARCWSPVSARRFWSRAKWCADEAAFRHHGCQHRSRAVVSKLHARPRTNIPLTSKKASCIIACPTCRALVARTATHAFVNAAMPYILEIANKGVEEAIATNPPLQHGSQYPSRANCTILRVWTTGKEE